MKNRERKNQLNYRSELRPTVVHFKAIRTGIFRDGMLTLVDYNLQKEFGDTAIFKTATSKTATSKKVASKKVAKKDNAGKIAFAMCLASYTMAVALAGATFI